MTTGTKTGKDRRPLGVTLVAVFSAAATLICVASVTSLLFPGSWIEPMWKIKPQAKVDFTRMGAGAVVLLTAVGAACAASSVGLWRQRRWAHRLTVVGVAVNLAGDAVRAFSDPRAAIGVPIAGAVIAYLLSRPVRSWFESAD